VCPQLTEPSLTALLRLAIGPPLPISRMPTPPEFQPSRLLPPRPCTHSEIACPDRRSGDPDRFSYAQYIDRGTPACAFDSA
jgi:hypothetical protein